MTSNMDFISILILQKSYLYKVPIPPPFVVIMILVVNDMASSFCWMPRSFAAIAAEASQAGAN